MKFKKYSDWKDVCVKETVKGTGRFVLIQVRTNLRTGLKQFKNVVISNSFYNGSAVTLENINN